MGCYHGFNASGGAQGVGQSTTYSVVSSSILILFNELYNNFISFLDYEKFKKISIKNLEKSFKEKKY